MDAAVVRQYEHDLEFDRERKDVFRKAKLPSATFMLSDRHRTDGKVNTAYNFIYKITVEPTSQIYF